MSLIQSVVTTLASATKPLCVTELVTLCAAELTHPRQRIWNALLRLERQKQARRVKRTLWRIAKEPPPVVVPRNAECWLCGVNKPRGQKWPTRTVRLGGNSVQERYCPDCFEAHGWPPASQPDCSCSGPRPGLQTDEPSPPRTYHCHYPEYNL